MTTEALLQTEVQHVTDAGDPAVTSLRSLDGDRALHGLPVRKIRSHTRARRTRHFSENAPPPPRRESRGHGAGGPPHSARTNTKPQLVGIVEVWPMTSDGWGCWPR